MDSQTTYWVGVITGLAVSIVLVTFISAEIDRRWEQDAYKRGYMERVVTDDGYSVEYQWKELKGEAQ